MSQNCLTDEMLAAFADGSTTGPERGAVEQHVAACDACRGELLALVRLLDDGPPAPAGTVERILARVERPTHPEARPMRFHPLLTAAALVAGVLLLLQATVPPPPAPRLSGTAAAVADGWRPGGAPRGLPATLDAGRAVAHLATDKPIYRAGERLYARAMLLAADTRAPVTAARWSSFEVRSPRGAVLHSGQVQAKGGVVPFSWDLPAGLAGGEYTLCCTGPQVAPGELTFSVRSYRVTRLKSDLQFAAKAYGPGERVRATLDVTRAAGGVPAGAQVTAVATVDGAEVHRGALSLDSGGRCQVAFSLPTQIARGDGTLALVIRDGGVTETAARTIPIVLGRLDMVLYPEGGDLVAGLSNRVYFEARDLRQAPADVAGRIVDDRGRVVARFASAHEGRGRFELTPEAGRSYRAEIDRPAGITAPVALPAAQRHGVVLTSTRERFAAGAPVVVGVAASADAELTVVLSRRERTLSSQRIRCAAGGPVAVALTGAGDGVLRVTVLDRDGLPRAERLVFRAPAHALNVSLTVDRARTVPGGEVTVDVRTTDAAGQPVSALVGLSATDDAVLSMIVRRERAARLAAAALLGCEVRELGDAGATLASPERTDLLLATQGWRRFGFAYPEAFRKAHAGLADRVLACGMRAPDTGAGEQTVLAVDGWRLAGGDLALRMGFAFGDEGRELGDKEIDGRFRRIDAFRGPRIALIVPDGKALRGLRGNWAQPVWIREYAHAPAKGRPAGTRSDFAETVYWHAGVQTDAEGKATVRFHVSDSITTFRVRADGVAADGGLGQADATVEVRRALYVEPKVPLEVATGDRIELPISVVNGTPGRRLARLRIEAGKGLEILSGATWQGEVPADGSTRAWVTLRARAHRGAVSLTVFAEAGEAGDEVTRSIRVVPAGYPRQISVGGLLARRAVHELTIPEGIHTGSMLSTTSVHASPLATLGKAVASLIGEPHGCFEQTSSTAYPNVMALQYLTRHAGGDPAQIARARQMLAKGYRRLTSFECKGKGYEWFGGDPGHEALTAYGVLEFTEMAAVHDVDPQMLARTRAWLLSRRDGKGGFARNPQACDGFGAAPQDITDAYILWALTEAGQRTELDRELAALERTAAASTDAYLLALAANTLWNAGRTAAANRALDQLASLQQPEGWLRGAVTSITRSGGRSLKVEAASLAVLAWLRRPQCLPFARKAMTWILQQCQGGRFGSTQATVLALKAIIAFDAAHAQPARAGAVRLLVDGEPVARVPFSASHQGPIALPDIADRLTPGRHQVALEMEDGSALPYSLQVRYHARTPASSDACAVRLETRVSRTKLAEGETVDVAVKLTSRRDEGLPMTTAIVGLPGGLEVRVDQLKELVKAGRIAFFETRGRDVILYWRALPAKAEIGFSLSCVAAVPGRYTGAASSAYLYYTDEHKHWAPGLEVEITR